MTRRHAARRPLLAALALLLLLAGNAPLLAQDPPAAPAAPAAYGLAWYTIDGGGHTSASGGAYTLAGTAGQPDAGEAMSGGPYRLNGGFWAGFGGAAIFALYLPLTVK